MVLQHLHGNDIELKILSFLRFYHFCSLSPKKPNNKQFELTCNLVHQRIKTND
ncbi:hypothetical protein Hanom_Chr17g01574691 [Helianthus anomalus]